MPEFPRRDLDDILARTESLWGELRNERIFLTGGTGFLGSWIVESFAHANSRLNLHARMVALTRRTLTSSHPSIQFHTGDIRTFGFPEGEFSHTIHGANERQSPDLVEIMTAGTERLLDFCVARGTRKLLYLSSGGIDGESAYARGKRAAEKLCLSAPKLQGRIARGFAFLGPGLPGNGFAAGEFIRDLLAGKPIRVSGTGNAVRSYLYTSDFCVWLWTILFRGEAGSIYNVGSDASITIGELARTIAANANPPLPVRVMGDPAAGESRYVPSIEKARRELGLQVNVPVEEAIRRTIDWCRAEK